jgi:prepilin-type N-terminal cleavage/methylation domain-containing protein
MKDRGITLIELIIVVSIIAVLILALGFSYQGWMGGYKVESQVKQMYVDLMNARARAMQRNRMHFADFPGTTSYRVSEDLNENGSVDAGEPLQTFPKTVEYTINAFTRDDVLNTSTAVVITTVTIDFDNRGFVSSAALFDPGTTTGIISITSTANPDYDCISVAETRILTGKMNGGNCVVK